MRIFGSGTETRTNGDSRQRRGWERQKERCPQTRVEEENGSIIIVYPSCTYEYRARSTDTLWGPREKDMRTRVYRVSRGKPSHHILRCTLRMPQAPCLGCNRAVTQSRRSPCDWRSSSLGSFPHPVIYHLSFILIPQSAFCIQRSAL